MVAYSQREARQCNRAVDRNVPLRVERLSPNGLNATVFAEQLNFKALGVIPLNVQEVLA